MQHIYTPGNFLMSLSFQSILKIYIFVRTLLLIIVEISLFEQKNIIKKVQKNGIEDNVECRLILYLCLYSLKKTFLYHIPFFSFFLLLFRFEYFESSTTEPIKDREGVIRYHLYFFNTRR